MALHIGRHPDGLPHFVFTFFFFLSTTRFSLKIVRNGKIKYELEQKPIALLGYNQAGCEMLWVVKYNP